MMKEKTPLNVLLSRDTLAQFHPHTAELLIRRFMADREQNAPSSTDLDDDGPNPERLLMRLALFAIDPSGGDIAFEACEVLGDLAGDILEELLDF